LTLVALNPTYLAGAAVAAAEVDDALDLLEDEVGEGQHVPGGVGGGLPVHAAEERMR
jgi:hypothetical protein